mmetsp:Transcript_25117/g.40578  ORF Transcript_25117/g.40578 Transcript_25117/m.40578 type:complete len:653 (+) Transcript_25117:165-2123(+)
METKNTSIDNLVGKLKTGGISKTELFSQLSALYEVDTGRGEEEEPTNAASMSPKQEDNKYNSSEKRKKIEDLLENFKMSLDNDDDENEEQDPVGEMSRMAAVGGGAEEELDVDGIQQSTERVLKNLKESMNSEFNFNPYAEDETYSNVEHQESVESRFRYQNNAAAQELANIPYYERLYRPQYGPRSREVRIKQLEAIMLSNEKKECSFKPEIKKMPGLHDNRDGGRMAIVERLYAWESKKKKNKKKKGIERVKKELDSCSFKPELNKTSLMLSSCARQDIRNVSLRSQARAKLVEREIRKQQEAEFYEECTFHPVINRNSRDMVSRNRSLQSYSQRSKKNEQRVLEAAMRECTFMPKTNPVKKSMQAANLYLEMTPFERLSQPAQKYANNEMWPDEYGQYPDEERPGRAREHSRISLVTTGISPKNISAPSPSFLERSRQHLERKQRTVEKLLAQEQERLYKPKLNKKSVKMARGKFYDRLGKDVTKRTLSQTLREKAKDEVSRECTFSPQINIMSKNLKPRSRKEMSEGDVALRSSKLELARMYARKQELSNVTFKPQRHTKNRFWDNYAKSRIKCTSEPHSYTERVMEMEARKQEHLERKKAELEERELGMCTFRPETKDAPEFVKRIADSMKASKKNQKKKKIKPDWK